MRKKIIGQERPNEFSVNEKWLDITRLAQVEITSEDTSYPIEDALTNSEKPGWRASEAGKQTLRIIFDEPQNIKIIHLFFEEKQQARSQEFLLRWSPDNEHFREIVRQQYNFNPKSSRQEQENYIVNLNDVKVIELSIIPNIDDENSYASISKLWMA